MRVVIIALLSFNLLAQAPSLNFENSCTRGEEVKISAVGDILMHLVLQVQSYRYANRNGQNFRHMWEELIPIFDQMDISYANLESPVVTARQMNHERYKPRRGQSTWRNYYDSPDYQYILRNGGTNYPRFNTGVELLDDLLLDFNLLSTANNHSADRDSLGIDATIDNLEERNILFTGTRRRGEPINERPWYAVANENGFEIAFIACTESTNGLDNRYQSNNDINRRRLSSQVLRCYDESGHNSEYLMDQVRTLSSEYDAVIVTPHWGAEYTQRIDQKRRNLSRELFENGALAIFGAHPHVVQPWEKMRVTDFHGKTKDRFVIYSLGNFIANQAAEVDRRTGIVLVLGLVRDRNQETQIQNVKYHPFFITTRATSPRRNFIQAVSYDHEHQHNNQTLRDYIEESDVYVNQALPRAHRISNINQTIETNFQIRNGQLRNCQ